MKDQDFDLYRWLIYGVIMLIIAAAMVWFPGASWAFVIVLIVAILDISYCFNTKYRISARK